MTREQNLILTGAEYQPHARFWREQLSAVGEGFTFRARLGAARDEAGGRGTHEHALSAAAGRSLDGLGKGQTPGKFVVLTAALYVALAEYSGHRVVALKTPLAGASEPSPLFESDVLLVGRVEGAATVRELIAAARETAALSYKHQNYPLDLAAAAGGAGAAEVTNVFLHAPGLHLAPRGAERFDLVVEASLASASPRLSLSYSRESLDEHFARALARTVERALEAFGDLDARLWDLDLLAPGERERHVAGFNATRREHGGAQLLHELFEEQAAKTPERAAVVHGERSLTYGELNRQAERVARRLAADHGVGPEDLVGLMVGRSELLVAALLGVLKAGACYVPIDPVYPDERIAHMLDDARPKVTLVSAEHVERAASFDGASATLVLEEAISLPAAETAETAESAPARAACLPEHPAYTIYTSGSTGRPKGVQVTHRAVVNFLRTMRETPGLGERDVLLAVTPLSFDIAALELYLPLTVGARVVVADRDESVDGGRLTRALAETGTTVMQATPASWRMLVESGWEGDGRLRAFTGGEALEPQLAARLLERVGELWNLYGPTETTIWSTAARLAEVARTIPLGAPVANTQVYVLDEWMRAVCVGAPGELCIGGEGLARGYLNRPALTAERFVPDPFSASPGARLYRTGDLVRFLPDGEIEFLGRLDYQVKIRGHRIELGEVESALAGHAGVRAAVVVARAEAGGGGGQRLVAYVVKDAGGPDASALRARLLERLPDYMMPSAFVFLEALPLTPNGKVDRKALPEPDPSLTAAEYVAPRTPVEEITCNLFAQILRLPRVGTANNLFDLGGHSLMATQLVSRVREVFGVELPLREIFERPTAGALAEAVEVALAGDVAAMMQPVTPAPRDAALPLSFSQRRLWFLDQLEPDSLAYHIPIPVRIGGVLDFGALSRAFLEVLRRHEALRTTFTGGGGGEPVQTIMPPAPVPLPVVDLSGLGPKERWDTTPVVAYEHTSVPFDLSVGPLINALVVRLAADDHYVLVTMHHIISDGWSVQVLARELSLLYTAYASGEASPLAELPVQFGDYAAWQRRLLQGELLEAQLSYWRNQLRGAPAALELPTDHPRQSLRRRPAGGVPLGLSPELAARVREACRRAGVTPFMLMLGCWAAVLARHSGQEEVLVGSPVAGRRRAELEGLVGFFVNTLALRVRAGRGETWGGLLRGVREVCLGAYTHQELPFERLVEEVGGGGREGGRTPLFQAMFAFDNTGGAAEAAAAWAAVEFEEEAAADVPPGEADGAESDGADGRVSVAPVKPPNPHETKFDLTLSFTESGDVWRGALEYDASLFDRETIKRQAEHFLLAVEAACENSEGKVWELELLRGDERRMVLEEWNQTEREYESEKCVHEMYAELARKHPDRVALVTDARELTYGELDAEANRLANRLRALGVGPETSVAVMLERSPELVVALLAVLKAGGTYVPLDPAYPAERLSLMLRDAGVKFLVTRRSLRDSCPDAEALRVVSLDEDADALARESAEAPANLVGPEHLAYVMYTSGSTGRPKGVMIHHRGVMRLVRSVNYAEFGEDETILHLATCAFDASTLEIWAALLNGGRLAVLPAGATSLSELAEAIGRFGVTTLWLTAGLFHQMVEHHPEALARVRQMMAGGDVLSATHVRKLLAHKAEGCVMNGYGPTETTVFACTNTIPAGGEVGDTFPIGRPITNTTVYILDERLRPLPVGLAGELYVGGPGLARGYLNRPGLTAEKFVPDPFSAEPGARLYRTGDLVRYLSDGRIDFLGRIDNQVKIRGFRIEPGEVEVALGQLAGVRQCVVVVREEVGGGGKRLVAYVVADEGSELGAAELRADLRERLPEYMVPSAFVLLDELPLNLNGKVDRKALPEPEAASAAAESYVAPRTPVEELVCDLFARVLGAERVGVEDNFFELGGHSLMATHLVSRVRETFDVELPLRGLFENPTPAGLALRVEERRRPEGWPESSAPDGATDAPSLIVPLQPSGSAPPFFCVHPGGGETLCYMELSRHLGADQPFMAIQAEEAVGVGARPAGVEEMAARYLAEVRRAQPEGPYHLGGWSFGGVIAFEMARQLLAQGERVAALTLIDSRIPPPGEPEPEDFSLLLTAAETLGLPAGSLETFMRRLSEIPRGEDGETGFVRARRAGLLPKELSGAEAERLFGVLKSHVRALYEYAPARVPVAVELLVAAQHGAGLRREMCERWEGLAAGGVRVREVPGGHHTILREPNVAVAAALLRESLEGARAAEFAREPAAAL